MNSQKGSTTNTILVLLLVAVVGFFVWYVTMRTEKTPDGARGLQINIGDNKDNNF